MLKGIQQRDLERNRWIKITMTVLLVLISLSMLTYLVPGLTNTSATGSPDSIARVGSTDISVADVQRQLNQLTRGQNIPPMLKGMYSKQVLDQMIFQHALELEARRLGIPVTPEEMTERIKQIIPTAFSGDTWLKDRYEAEVQARSGGMSVSQFEEFLRNEMLLERFHALITDGITVSPMEIEQEFRRRNEKVQVQYAAIKPEELAPSIHPTDAQLSAYFAKNSSKYQVLEKRSARYALLDLNKLRAHTQVGDETLRAYYNAHIDQYKVENRVHVEHILFKTIGKTDAEIAEIRQKAEDVLKQAKKGANFEELAKKYSEDDATKPKGGDLGWIVEGQTVPEFQQAAFSLPKGSISDLVKTQYGFHIIKVLDRETAHTKSFEEVRDTIVPIVLDEKVRADADNISNQMASAVRQSNRQSLDDLAKKFNLEVGDTPPASVTDPVGDLGNSPDLHQILFQLRPGELSSPLQTEKGFAILTVKDVQPAHQGTLAEVRDRVLSDYQQEQSVQLARSKAEDLAKRTAAGESFEQVAKSLGIDLKTPDPFSRTGSIPDLGSGRQLEAAFSTPVGQVSTPTQLGSAWVVYKVVAHQPVILADLAAQSSQIEQQLLQAKQGAAFDAFRTALEDRLKREGKLTINNDALKRLSKTS
ncbi:MAG TPA: peptidylprolyl isomerase [Candidatus Acidoferrum sp.]|nr:peptidylprolyl isomerase [Candidatus Acidoferrum sp.]